MGLGNEIDELGNEVWEALCEGTETTSDRSCSFLAEVAVAVITDTWYGRWLFGVVIEAFEVIVIGAENVLNIKPCLSLIEFLPNLNEVVPFLTS